MSTFDYIGKRVLSLLVCFFCVWRFGGVAFVNRSDMLGWGVGIAGGLLFAIIAVVILCMWASDAERSLPKYQYEMLDNARFSVVAIGENDRRYVLLVDEHDADAGPLYWLLDHELPWGIGRFSAKRVGDNKVILVTMNGKEIVPPKSPTPKTALANPSRVVL